MELIPGSKESRVEEKEKSEKSVRVLQGNGILRRRKNIEFNEGTIYKNEAGARTSPGEMKHREAKRSWKPFSPLGRREEARRGHG